MLICVSDFEFVLVRFHMAASQQMLLSALQGRSVDFTTVSLPVYYCGIMLADTTSHLYMYQAIHEYSGDGPASVRLYLLSLLFLEKSRFFFLFFFKPLQAIICRSRGQAIISCVLQVCSKSSSYVFHNWLRSVILLVDYLVSYNWNLI